MNEYSDFHKINGQFIRNLVDNSTTTQICEDDKIENPLSICLTQLSVFRSENCRTNISESVLPLNISILSFGQILFNFLPYNLTKFCFLQDIIFLLIGNRITAQIEALKRELLNVSMARKLVQLVTNFIWPNSKLVELDDQERKLEDKIMTEKQTIRQLTQILLKSKGQLSENNAMKVAFEVVSSFKDSTINKHLIFCVLDAIFNVVYN